jgi:SAM-dependent methyltransferase
MAATSTGRRLAGWALAGLAAAHVAEGLVLRRRLAGIPVLKAPSATAAATDARVAPAVVTIKGQAVDARTLAAAGATLDGDGDGAGGIEAVDLVPGLLPADRALRLLRRIDPDKLAADALYTPGGAHEAVVLHPALASRLNTRNEWYLDRGAMVRRTVDVQRYAPRKVRLRIEPGMSAAPQSADDRWHELDELTAFGRTLGSLPPFLIGAETAHLLAMTAGLLIAPLPAAAAIVTWSLQPAIVLSGQQSAALKPPDAEAKAAPLRLPRAWAANVRTVAAGFRKAKDRAANRTALPPTLPTDELFEPRRPDCAWCGSADLVTRLDTPDRLQHKPGHFHLDECTACGHIFQNPRLSLAGLDHYYAEFYEGFGEEAWSQLFAAMAPAYAKRMDTLARFAEPRAWLDVGTGHAHFCLAARQRWPETTFDGLDIGEPVEEARRRGWIDNAYQGLLPDLADGLPRSYDVVTMHHYLEHTRDPRLELAAAAKVLEPGGHLMIEVPDPASPWSKRLGPLWRCWFQPQHQHFVRCENLVAALEGMSFEVVSVERGPATEGLDLSSAVSMAMDGLAPYPHTPWGPTPTVAAQARRFGVMTAAVPALAVAGLADLVKDAWVRRPGTTDPGNAYRVVARRI